MMAKDPSTKAQISFLKFKITRTIILNTLLATLLVVLILSAYILYISDRYIFNLSIADNKVAFLTKQQAYNKINTEVNQRLQTDLSYQYQGKNYTINLTETKPTVDINHALDQAYTQGHSGNVLLQIQQQFKTAIYGYTVTPKVQFDANLQIEAIAKQIDKTPENATIWLDEQNKVHIKEGIIGTEIDKTALEDQISNYILFGYYPGVLPIKNIDPSFTTQEAKQAQIALESLQQQPVELTFENKKWNLDVPTLFHLLNLDQSPISDNGQDLLDETKFNNYVKDIATKIDRPVEEPLFKFDANNRKVDEFQPAQLGQELDQDKTKQLILTALINNQEKKITLPVEVVHPKIQTSEINNLGIKELIGQGVSNFSGSIPNRIYNVNLTANRINGVLIPPGETFSFNRTVGEISGATGFKQAYVIKEGRTVLDDGGGVCQVSTTLFRAALNSGVPITDRTAHAYRVAYYEQGFKPGIDATIFHPSVDFKFKNDTPGHILIQSRVEGTTLYVDFYGTSDGRTVELTTPVIGEQTPPPPELRQDDPTLPRGQVKQVDWAAWGAKVSFKRTVTKDGQVVANETWRSNYRPWQAVYLVGTKD